MQDNSEVMRAIGRLEGKVDSLISDALSDGKVQADHERRIGALEKKQYALFVVGGVIGSGILTLIKAIPRFFNWG